MDEIIGVLMIATACLMGAVLLVSIVSRSARQSSERKKRRQDRSAAKALRLAACEREIQLLQAKTAVLMNDRNHTLLVQSKPKKKRVK